MFCNFLLFSGLILQNKSMKSFFNLLMGKLAALVCFYKIVHIHIICVSM